MMKLYSYYRSSAAYRVRLALDYKQLPYDLVPVNLVPDGGEHLKPAYQAINPQGLVPSLQLADHTTIAQSLAIIEYLEELAPTPALLPTNLVEKAQVRALALLIACDIHPLNNMRVLKYLKHDLHVSEEQKMQWYYHWLEAGFNGFEKSLAQSAGTFCVGDTFSLADVCLIPQIYNAKRFDYPLNAYPTIERIANHCLTLPWVQKACPEAQIDAPKI